MECDAEEPSRIPGETLRSCLSRACSVGAAPLWVGPELRADRRAAWVVHHDGLAAVLVHNDWVSLPHFYGVPVGDRPPQRATRALGRGRPCVLMLDHPELRPRRSQGCTAHRRHGRGPCGAWAVRGATVCRMHGGAAPQVRRAAAERLEVDRQRRALVRAGHDRKCRA